MPIRLAVPNEIAPGERRIALDPVVAKKLNEMGVDVRMQKGAAASALFAIFPSLTIILSINTIETASISFCWSNITLKSLYFFALVHFWKAFFPA